MPLALFIDRVLDGFYGKVNTAFGPFSLFLFVFLVICFFFNTICTAIYEIHTQKKGKYCSKEMCIICSNISRQMFNASDCTVTMANVTVFFSLSFR